MKFVCDRCQTKYSIADDKVRGKVLKVRCKTCQNVITVREAGAKPSVGSLAPVRPSQRPTGSPSAPLATLGDAHEELSERTSIAPAPAGLMADLLQGRRATPPPPPPLGDGIEWFLALEGAQQGPFPRKLLVDRLLALPKGADVHVWNDAMDGWKPPADVPDVAADLAARRPPTVPTRPPLPRTTPSPPPPPLAARRGTQPLTSGVGSKLPLPAPHVAAAHAHAVPAPHAGADEAAMPTPPPLAAHGLGRAGHSAPGHAAKTNGVAAHASSPGLALAGGESDALSALNLGGGAVAPAAAPRIAPRIMEVGEATAWSGAGRVQEGRHRNTKLVFALLGVVCVIIVVVALNMTKKPPVTATTPTTVKGGLDSESLAKLHDVIIEGGKPMAPQGGATAEEPAGPATAVPETGHGKPTHGHPAPHGRPLHGATGPAASASAGAAAAAAPSASGGGFRERSVTPVSAIANRPPPSQADITRVIANNKLGIKTCYQRALLRDSNLTHGKIVVGVTIGISGRVKGVRVDGPSSFRSLEPCIKEMVGRWTFPQASDEYGTEFSYLFQGNE